jgi:hypothetical protein
VVAVSSYRVVVTREDGAWLADVPDLQGAHTFARNLPALDRYVREVIALAADLEDAADVTLEWEIHTGDDSVDKELGQLRAERDRLDARRKDVEAQTASYARALAARGFSVRDTGALLGVSPQRAQQLISA